MRSQGFYFVSLRSKMKKETLSPMMISACAFAFLWLMLVILSGIRTAPHRERFLSKPPVDAPADQHKCGLSCNSLDPLLEPSYNMKEVAKQTILLEEHIAFKNKRCVQCIFKHFLHIIALLNEAIWLAMDKIHEYPLLLESPKFYETLMETYSCNQDNEAVLLDILAKLRDHRKKIVEAYYMQKNNDTCCSHAN